MVKKSHRHYSHHKRHVHPHHVHRRKHHLSLLSLLLFGGLGLLFLYAVAKYIPSSWFSRAKTEEELVGDHEVIISEDFNRGNAVIKHYISTKSQRLEIANPQFMKKTGGEKIKVKGKKLADNVFELTKDSTSSITQPETFSTGAKKIAVLLVDFADKVSTSLTAAQAATHINSDFRGFYLENSFNKLSLSGDAYGRYRLSTPFTCDVWTILSEAVGKADSEVNFSQYQGIMIVFPDSTYVCGFAGVSTLGPITVASNDGSFSMLTSWYTDGSFSLRATAHEFAHGLGAYHANGWNCGSEQVGTSCDSIAYADPVDPMGISGGGNHFGMYYKELFGWTTSSNVQTITKSGKYKLSPIEKLASGPQVLKISKGDGSYYYIYHRTSHGFDADLAAQWVTGATISWNPTNIQSGDTHLVDTTPNSANSEFTLDFQDAPLGLGRTFVDTSLNLRVAVFSKRADVLTIDVTLPR